MSSGKKLDNNIYNNTLNEKNLQSKLENNIEEKSIIGTYESSNKTSINYKRKPRYYCRFLYYNFQIDMNYSVQPCCYMDMLEIENGKWLKYDGRGDFLKDVWNNKAMVELRRSLVEGPITGRCQNCPPIWE